MQISIVADKHLYEYVLFTLEEFSVCCQLYGGGCRPPWCTHKFTSVTEPGIIAFCVGDFPEGGHIVAETCRRHILK
jgi:hypothetical protein